MGLSPTISRRLNTGLRRLFKSYQSLKVLTGAPRPDPWIRKVIDGRYCKGSTILTTNIDFAELGDYLGDPVITAATVDRMVHHSIIINIEGPSWRLHQSQQLNSKQ